MIHCRNCGKEILGNNQFCIHCGAKVPVDGDVQSGAVKINKSADIYKKGLIWFVFAAFIGITGVVLKLYLLFETTSQATLDYMKWLGKTGKVAMILFLREYGNILGWLFILIAIGLFVGGIVAKRKPDKQ